ncbi:hypothetical protein GGE32_005512 [Rhizobium leguminosarum]|nr:hypothetical protein [Rhizobium leguminosarum]MBB4357086.1 hypothetical protein [Rhizobium leguminosarum]MBB4551646.1 hypothetical protein [Rhizobium leguminosarum]MBB4564239.1 hypothetical protein [Rhizobium leguminosarum]
MTRSKPKQILDFTNSKPWLLKALQSVADGVVVPVHELPRTGANATATAAISSMNP